MIVAGVLISLCGCDEKRVRGGVVRVCGSTVRVDEATPVGGHRAARGLRFVRVHETQLYGQPPMVL